MLVETTVKDSLTLTKFLPRGDLEKGPVFTRDQEILSYSRNGSLSLILTFSRASDLWKLMRARYYDPETGRFLTQDPKKGNIKDPISTHPYLYCRNNPIRYTDPSGNDVYIGDDGVYYITIQIDLQKGLKYGDVESLIRKWQDEASQVWSGDGIQTRVIFRIFSGETCNGYRVYHYIGADQKLISLYQNKSWFVTGLYPADSPAFANYVGRANLLHWFTNFPTSEAAHEIGHWILSVYTDEPKSNKTIMSQSLWDLTNSSIETIRGSIPPRLWDLYEKNVTSGNVNTFPYPKVNGVQDSNAVSPIYPIYP